MTERLPSPRRPNARQRDSTYQTGQRCSDKRDYLSFQIVAPSVPVPDLRYEYSWDFGDFSSFGPVDLGVIPADNVTRVGLTAPAHAYGDDGQSVVTLTVNAFEGDRLATAESDSFIVTITNADPIVQAVGGSEGRSVAEGGTASINPPPSQTRVHPTPIPRQSIGVTSRPWSPG